MNFTKVTNKKEESTYTTKCTIVSYVFNLNHSFKAIMMIISGYPIRLVKPVGSRLFHITSKMTAAAAANPIVKIKPPFGIAATPIDSKYRLGYDPIYTSPTYKNIATLKRATLAIGVIGIYASYLINGSPIVANEWGYLISGLTLIPIPTVGFMTQHYVSRIFRLYDSTKPQTLENLTTDETLVAEKISWTGRSYYNRLVKVQDLRLTKERFGWVNWKTDKDKFYVIDDLGGIKMDRIWGIVEHNSGVNNGRFFEK